VTFSTNATRYEFSTSDSSSLGYSISGYWTAFNENTTVNGIAYIAGSIFNQNIKVDRDGSLENTAGDFYYKYGLGDEDTVSAIGNVASAVIGDTYYYHVESTAYNEAAGAFNTLGLDWSLFPPSAATLYTNTYVRIEDGEIVDENYESFEIFNNNFWNPESNDTLVDFVATTVAAEPSTIVCFAKGSLIAAQSGSVAVEKLKVGDKVLTVTGQYETIKWVGHRRVNCNKHSRPTEAWPVRVSKDAFGAGMPNQDLYLSPAHSVYVYGHLVPIIHLVNDVTIVQEERPTVIYYHIELDHHSVIYAQGLPSETFLDSTNRKFFMTASSNVTTLAGADEEFSELAGREKYLANCFAPFVTEGPVLEAIYEKLVGKPAYQAYALFSERLAA
jgi:hypothetical protein